MIMIATPPRRAMATTRHVRQGITQIWERTRVMRAHPAWQTSMVTQALPATYVSRDGTPIGPSLVAKSVMLERLTLILTHLPHARCARPERTAARGELRVRVAILVILMTTATRVRHASHAVSANSQQAMAQPALTV